MKTLMIMVASVVFVQSGAAFAEVKCEQEAKELAVEYVAKEFNERFFDTIVNPRVLRANDSVVRIGINTPERSYFVDVNVENGCEDLKVTAADWFE